jgi:hypothetical protein
MPNALSLEEGCAPADLHPDLEEWLDPPGAELRFIRHPLLVTPYEPALTPNINQDFEHKVRDVENAREANDWEQYVWLHEKAYRAEVLYEVAHLLEDRDYWRLVAEVWTLSENIWQSEDKWRKLLTATRPHRELLMSEEEQSALADLSSPIRIYRGFCRPERQHGFSWTRDRQQAEVFAGRSHRGVPQVAVGLTSQPLAYLNDRGEQELIVLPEHVSVIKVESLVQSEE